MKSIYHVITTINRGGAENQLLVLVAEQISKGYQVTIIYLKGNPELRNEFTNLGATVINTVSRFPVTVQPFAIAALILKKDVILHAHLPRSELVSLFVPAKFTLITSRHNSEPFFPGAPKLLSNFFSRLVEMRAKRIIAISESVSDFLFEQGEVKDPQKVRVIYYGYQISNLNRGNLLNRSTNHCKLGTISRLAEQKDLPTMIRAFEIYKLKKPNATLSIVGAGPLEKSLRDLINSLGAEKEIFLLGRRNDVMNFLGALDVFILTSKYEGFGMVLLEAMDAGVPIIASRNTAIVEVLGADFPGLCETGNSIDFSTALLKLQDLSYREEILKIQEQRLYFFQARLMVEKVIETYYS